MIRKRLIDAFPEWTTSGIFASLQSLNVPWKNENIAIQLDLEYFGNISGEKRISPLVSKIMSGDSLTTAEITALANVIYSVNKKNWVKLYATLNFEYNPIENYSMTETMTDDTTVIDYGKDTKRTDNLTHAKTGTETLTDDTTNTRTDNLTHAKTGTETLTDDTANTRTDNLTHAKTGTETLTHNTTETTTPNLTNNTANSLYGFNSSSAVPTGTQSQTATGSNTVTKTGTETTQYNLTETNTGTETTVIDGEKQTTFNTSETNTGTETTVIDGEKQTSYNVSDIDTGTQRTEETGTDTHTRNYELTRKGNIGVTTSQQMIESERNLWLWNFFYTVVFPDIDRVLTIQIY